MFKVINGWTKEKMKEHIVNNFKGKATGKNEIQCEYKTQDGRKCAVGMFIPEDCYESSMDGSVNSLLFYWPKVILHMPLEEDGLTKMQLIHDNSAPEDTLQDLLTFIDKNVEE